MFRHEAKRVSSAQKCSTFNRPSRSAPSRSTRRKFEQLEARQLLAADLLNFETLSALQRSELPDATTVIYSKATGDVQYQLPSIDELDENIVSDAAVESSSLDDSERFVAGQEGIELSFPPGYFPDQTNETVHGADDRIRVNNTLSVPFSSIVRIESSYSDGGGGICTGAIVDANHVLTAGHCVHRSGVGFASDFDIFPAQDEDTKPFGEVDWQTVRSYTGWTNNQNSDHDWALITLDRDIGLHTGWMGRQVRTVSQLVNANLNTAGYPGDLSSNADEMYRAFGTTNGASDFRFFYSGLDGLDTFGGQSGSPMYRYLSSQNERYIVGIHTTGGSSVNGATRLNDDKFDQIDTWIATDVVENPSDNRADLVDFDDYFDTSLASISTSFVRPGESLSVTSYSRNNGVVPTGVFDVTFYASTNSTITTADTELGTVRLASLDPFTGSEATLDVASFPDLPAGEYYIGWRIDSTSLVSEYDEGNNRGILPSRITVADPVVVLDPVEIYFSAITSSGQRELHVTDGTAGGTGLFRDLSGGVASHPRDFTWVEDKLFFTATMPTGERELFKSFGTPATTSLVRNISGSLSSDPQELTAVGNRLYFTALLPNGQRELFRTRGTSSTTVLVDNLGGTRSANPTDLVAVDNELYFTATTTSGQRELHVTSGSRSDTRIVRDLSGGVSSNPTELTRVGNRVFFAATIPSGERELFVTDGTASGTRLARNLSGSTSSNPTNLTAFGNRVYFVATLPNGEREMFFSRGSTSNTNLLANLSGTRSSSPTDLVVADDQLFFVATLADGQKELHVTDGNRSNTQLVKDISGSTNARPLEMIPYGRDVLFTAQMSDGQRELYRSDGTAAGTRRLANVSGSTNSTPRDLVVADNRVFFSARREDIQRELFVYDLLADNLELVRDLSGSQSSNPIELISRQEPDGESFGESTEETSSSNPENTETSTSQSNALTDATDVNADGRISALDALQIVNRLNVSPRGTSVEAESSENDDFEDESEWVAVMDLSGDGRITALDALIVINRLRVEAPSSPTTVNAIQAPNQSSESTQTDDDVEDPPVSLDSDSAERQQVASFQPASDTPGSPTTSQETNSSTSSETSTLTLIDSVFDDWTFD
ncbi:dockerin type I domain-containing protein [Rubripirellula amarantea]|nr:dockerin type I domain-containing protein [Rubripirellula amarantea]